MSELSECNKSVLNFATHQVLPAVSPRDLVDRPRLIEHINRGLDRSLTLVTAPAGYGKSILVSAWLSTCERPGAWLTLDETVVRRARRNLVAPRPRPPDGGPARSGLCRVGRGSTRGHR